MPPACQKNIGPRQRVSLAIWRRFLDGQPEYLARHYWWAYLWRVGVWFFDHQPIINAILFGQYKTLSLKAQQACITRRPKGRFLQLTCAYGSLTPSLLKTIDDDLYLLDVAQIQLDATRKKLTHKAKKRLLSVRMNAESLAYRDDSFASILVFFLLHELPAAARERALREVVRVLRPGGRLVITEYGACPTQHGLWRFWPSRRLLLWLEPFLGDFWQLDLSAALAEQAHRQGKSLTLVDESRYFSGFYRVCVYEMDDSTVSVNLH